MAKSINIRPGVSILSVLQHLKYEIWYALAEFVDNSIQSYMLNKDALHALHGPNFRLEVRIETSNFEDDKRITIRDNAAGIAERDYERAFRPAELPPDRTGLSEFGMGMKSAACWLSKRWKVKTTALGEQWARTVQFDIAKIVEDRIEELTVLTEEADTNVHFTVITLLDINHFPQTKTVSRIRDHLSSIYRNYIRNDQIRIYYDNELLSYDEPETLEAASAWDPNGQIHVWRKEIDFDLGDDFRVNGFAAIRKTASTARAGFALIRRGRVIEGSGDKPYRPAAIFGSPNSFRYQRLFGELHLEGFEVSHTKDGIKWNGQEEAFLELLAEELDKDPLSLLRQANLFRSNPSLNEIQGAAARATRNTADILEANKDTLGEELERPATWQALPTNLSTVPTMQNHLIEFEVDGQSWKFSIELTNDPSVEEWLSVSDDGRLKSSTNVREVALRMSLAHPFIHNLVGTDSEKLELVMRIAVAIVFGEMRARNAGATMVGTVRDSVNSLLRDVLSKLD